MNEEAFWKFLKRGGRSQSAAKRVLAQVTEYKQYLLNQRDCKKLDEASPEDLEAFVSFAEEKKERFREKVSA